MRMQTYSLGNLGASSEFTCVPGTVPGMPLFGLSPGDPCYDSTFMPGLTHGANLLQDAFCNSCTSCVSTAEASCLSTGAVPGGLVTVNPPSTPSGYQPSTSTSPGYNPNQAAPGQTLSPAPSTTTVNYGCDPDNPTDNSCIATNTSNCPWYCSLPFASSIDSTYSSDCAACPSGTGNTATALAIGVAVLGVLLLFTAAKNVRVG